jgi:hypothetical protein
MCLYKQIRASSEVLIMDSATTALTLTAASLGFFHTIIGPDHYLPFVMMSWAMYPAATSGWAGVIIVTTVFGSVIITTMVGAVLLIRAGVNFVRLSFMGRFAHAIAGATICLYGLAIQFGL